MLLVGMTTEETLPLLPATGRVALLEVIAGDISLRPKFNKLLETLFMFRGATFALILKKKKENIHTYCCYHV